MNKMRKREGTLPSGTKYRAGTTPHGFGGSVTKSRKGGGTVKVDRWKDYGAKGNLERKEETKTKTGRIGGGSAYKASKTTVTNQMGRKKVSTSTSLGGKTRSKK